MVSDHLDFVREMTYAMNESGRLTDAERKQVLRHLTSAANILDKAEQR